MKKFTFNLLAISLIAISVYAGTEKRAAMRRTFSKADTHPFAQMRQGLPGNHVNSAAFYSEDFASGIPAGWQNIDSSGNGSFWKHTTTGALIGDALNASGTSAANGYMLYDSDSLGGSIGGEDAIIISASIDCSSRVGVHLTYNEYFVQYAATATVSVSNDGINWTNVYSADAGLGQNQASANPKIVDVDISAVADNQATVYVRFRNIGDYDYYWMVDDIQLYEAASFDGSVVFATTNFNGCTLGAAENITMVITNPGVSDISNFTAGYIINGGSPVTETVTDTLSSGDTLIYTFTTTADLSVAQVYNIDAFVSVTSDGNTANDTSSTSTTSYDPVMIGLGPSFMGFEASEDYSAWTVQDIDGDGFTFDVTSINPHTDTFCLRKIGNTLDDDNWLYSQCTDLVGFTTYKIDFWYRILDVANPCSLEVYLGSTNDTSAMTQNLSICALADTGWQNSVNFFTVPSTGTYYFGFHFYSNLGFGNSSMRVDDILIDIASAVNDNNQLQSVYVYPNPSSGIFNINSSEKGNSILTITDLTGRIIYSKQYSGAIHDAINLSDKAHGIYTLKLSGEKGVFTKTISITQ